MDVNYFIIVVFVCFWCGFFINLFLIRENIEEHLSKTPIAPWIFAAIGAIMYFIFT